MSHSAQAQASYKLFKCMYRYSDEMLKNERMVNLSSFLFTSCMYIRDFYQINSGKCTNICNTNHINHHQMFSSKIQYEHSTNLQT